MTLSQYDLHLLPPAEPEQQAGRCGLCGPFADLETHDEHCPLVAATVAIKRIEATAKASRASCESLRETLKRVFAHGVPPGDQGVDLLTTMVALCADSEAAMVTVGASAAAAHEHVMEARRPVR